MNRKDCISKAKNIILGNLEKSFPQSIASIGPDDAMNLISALIYSLGYEHVNVVEERSLIRFYGNRVGGDDDEVLIYYRDSKDIAGSLETEIPSTFFVVQSIEGRLSDSLELPHQMRQKRIQAVISSAGVTEDRYVLILKNWKSF
ncbi:MAG: hypothetical protein VX787_03605 [Pseudomonadota bacterium]|nr:hypothetical protein [Pseudomonadota bacterium]